MSALVGVAVALAPAAARAGATPVEVIAEQLDAFERRDPRAAYELASAGMREGHHPVSLTRMMSRKYPEIATSVAVLVLEQYERTGGWYVRARVTGANLKTVEALFRLVQEAGDWRVDEVVTHPVPDQI